MKMKPKTLLTKLECITYVESKYLLLPISLSVKFNVYVYLHHKRVPNKGTLGKFFTSPA